MMLQTSQSQLIRKMKKRHARRETLIGYLFVSGFLLCYIIFTLYPMIDAFVLSFFSWDIVNPRTFAGLNNYKTVLTDSRFWSSLWHTIEFLLYSTIPLMLGSFGLALLINCKSLKFPSLFRGIYFSPNVLTVTIVSYIWLKMLDPMSGIMNKGLKAVGLLASGMRSQIYWTSDPNVVWWAITLITLWWTVGYNMILYLSAMQNIPDAIYEAAELDGANAFKRLIYITFPYLKDMHVTLLFMQIISSFKVYGQIYLVTKGGPSGRTTAFIQYIYETAFGRFQIGQGCAASILFFIVIFVVSFTQMKLMNRSKD